MPADGIAAEQKTSVSDIVTEAAGLRDRASVGGTTRRTTAAVVEWSVSGAPTAVAEVCAALESE